LQEEAAKVRRSEREDISDHPEYRAKAREAETLAESVRVLTADLEAARREMADLPEQEARLSAEAATATEKARTLSAKVEELQAELARRPTAVTAPVAAPVDLAGPLSQVAVAVDALSDCLVVLGAALKDASAVLDALDPAGLPPEAQAAMGTGHPRELSDALRDVRRMLTEDLEALRAAWDAARPLWQPGS